jgi:hypothetical protein
MHPPALAKLRSLRRRREAGAVMFVIAMAIAVLASVGVYALSAASTELRTSGNERQNTQTHYLAQYGVLGATHELAATKAQFYMGLMLVAPDSPCVSLPGVPTVSCTSTGVPAGCGDPLTRACRRIGSAELSAQWGNQQLTVPYGSTTPFAPATNPGSFGATPMAGDFFLELTDPIQLAPPARYSLDLHFCFIQVTVTSSGTTQPLFPANVTAQYGGEGVEVQRARVEAGPVMSPK